MEGSDALLAARLAAGDDRALAEVFDQPAPSVYGGALRVLGNGSAAPSSWVLIRPPVRVNRGMSG